MKNVVMREYNIWADNDRGEHFRAIAIAGHWRLCKENPKRPGDWLFFTETEYLTGIEAINDLR